ncbi:uncharacterized protein LOC107303841 [Oryza brachyantha]|uniref:uncharacterized protein LOC107303841 n=1 Tax=Oryza brachyantha TaxID=4533 RepID=UPI0007767969|nr:uncharacterized protein LOC107303841 [Oryza brachyantha]
MGRPPRASFLPEGRWRYTRIKLDQWQLVRDDVEGHIDKKSMSHNYTSMTNHQIYQACQLDGDVVLSSHVRLPPFLWSARPGSLKHHYSKERSPCSPVDRQASLYLAQSSPQQWKFVQWMVQSSASRRVKNWDQRKQQPRGSNSKGRSVLKVYLASG